MGFVATEVAGTVVHLFNYIDNFSLLCLIKIEEYPQITTKDLNVINLSFAEIWCEKTLNQMKVFLENRKFINKKTCLCQDCIDDFDFDYNALPIIYNKVSDSIPLLIRTINRIVRKIFIEITYEDKIYLRRLSKFLLKIQSELQDKDLMNLFHFHN